MNENRKPGELTQELSPIHNSEVEMRAETKVAIIRSFGYWVRECTAGPVKYIIVDPHDSESGWMCAGDDDALDDTIDALCMGAEKTVKAEAEKLGDPIH